MNFNFIPDKLTARLLKKLNAKDKIKNLKIFYLPALH